MFEHKSVSGSLSSNKLIFICAHGKDNPERASLPFVAANVAGGGKVWLCGACTKPRGITEEQLGEGATVVGAAKIVEEIAAGARSISFA